MSTTTVRELINLIGFKVDKGQMNKANAMTDKFINGLKTAGVIAGTAIIAIGTAAINAAADMESLTAQFEVMLGSAEKANVFVKELQNFSKVTPFQLKDLSENSKLMLSFGIASEDVMDNLRMLGDVAGNNREKLSSLTLAFSQIQSTGRLMGQDLLQLINAGFNPLKIISQQTGKSMGILKEEMSKGKISAEMVTEAFRVATSEGGLFFQNMEKQSKTFSGMLSTLKDNITLVLVEIGNKLLPIMKQIFGRITELFQGSLGQIISDLMTVVEPILKIVFKLLETITNGLMPLVKLLTDILIPLLNIVTILLEPINEVLQIIFELFGDIAKELGEAFVPLLIEVANLLNELMPAIIPIVKIIARISAFFLKLRILANTLFMRIMIKALTLILKLLNPIINLLMKFLVPVLEWIEVIIDNLIIAIEEGIGKLPQIILNAIKKIIDGISNLAKLPLQLLEPFIKFFEERFPNAFNKIKEIVQGVSDFVSNLFENISTGIKNTLKFIFEMVNKAITAINKLPFMKKKLKPLDINALEKEIVKREENNQTYNNINMKNQMTFTGVDNSRQGAIKQEVREAIGSPFQMEILRVLQEL